MATLCDTCKKKVLPNFKRSLAGSMAATIFWCSVYDKEGHCPYVPDHHHIPREGIIPPEFSHFATLATSSGEYFEHPSIVKEYENPEIEGNFVQIFKLD